MGNNFLKVLFLLCALPLTACSQSITKENIQFATYADASKINRSTASIPGFTGNTIAIVTRHYGKDKPIERAVECLEYTEAVMPSKYGQVGGAMVQEGFFDTVRNSLMYRVQRGVWDEKTALVALIGAVVDGFRGGDMRYMKETIAELTKCYNGGGDTHMMGTLVEGADD
jgi:hypothetical protein